MWLLAAFQKPIRTGSLKPLNLQGGKCAVHMFQKHLPAQPVDATPYNQLI
jgi:hypothetical protein